MSNDAIFGAEGMIKFMATLRYPNSGRQEFRFPAAEEWQTVDFTCKEVNPRDFFVRLIDATVSSGIVNEEGAIGSCQFEEGLAVFMEVKWCDERLLHCSIQVVASPEADLETLYQDVTCQGVYYRCDYSVDERGELFNHPFPHIHSVPEGAPRLHFAMNPRIFLPFAFLEVVMLNHHYEKWLTWILREYSERHPGDIPIGEPTPEKLLKDFKIEADWKKIDEVYRRQFLSRVRRASRDAMERISERYPKVDSELLALNYWQDNTPNMGT